MAAAGTKSPLLVFWRARRFDLYLSPEIVNELKALLSRPKIQRFVSQTSGKQFLDLLGERAVFVIPATNYPAVVTLTTIW
jgi:predicted nucleic acid-binding protein